MAGRPDAITRGQYIVLTIIAFAAFMGTLDSAIVNISLPTIASSFGADISIISWVVLAYLFVLAGLLLPAGRLGDLHGFRRVFLAGFAVFTLGSLFCGLSGNIQELVASRVLQGIGGAALEALAPAMILHYLPENRRGWALGMLATVVSLGIAAGPLLGGFITEYASWHWIFLINVPVGTAAVLLGLRYLPADHPSAAGEPFDRAGAVLILGTLITLLFPINQGLVLGWTSPVILGSFCASLLLGSFFVIHERRCTAPLVDMHLFASRGFLSGNALGFIFTALFAGGIFLLPFFFETVQGLPTDIVGILLAIPSITIMLLGPVSGTFSDRYGTRLPTTGAAIVLAAAFLVFSLFSPSTGLTMIMGAMLLLGIGIGIFFPPNLSQVLGSCPQGCQGVASSVMMTLRYCGGMIGVAVFGTITSLVVAGTMASRHLAAETPEVLAAGFSASFTVGVLLCLAGAVIAAGIRETRPRGG